MGCRNCGYDYCICDLQKVPYVEQLDTLRKDNKVLRDALVEMATWQDMQYPSGNWFITKAIKALEASDER